MQINSNKFDKTLNFVEIEISNQNLFVSNGDIKQK